MLAILTIPVLLAVSQTTTQKPNLAPVPVRPVTACMAVTRAEIEDALGRSIGDGAEEIGRTMSACDYSAWKANVTIAIHRLTSDLNVESEIASLKSTFPTATLRDTSGIGTRAFLLHLPAAGTQVHVIQGTRYYVLVSVLGFGDAAQVSAAAETIARKVVARL